MAVLSCKGTKRAWMQPYRGIPRMKKTFNQLTCLYQLWRLIWVSAIWTFLEESVALGRTSAGLADMVVDRYREMPETIVLCCME